MFPCRVLKFHNKVVSFNHIVALFRNHLYEDIPPRGNLQKFRMTVFDQFSVPSLNHQLHTAIKAFEEWDHLVPA